MITSNSTIGVDVAYLAMFHFLDAHWEKIREARTGDTLGTLLDLMVFNGPEPVDPTKWDDWLAAVKEVLDEDPNSRY